MLRIIKPGLQSTLQGAPRIGTRHLGFPYSGPADAISMSLANRLVQNDLAATCLEITYGGFEATVETACSVSVTGAFDRIAISGRPASAHETLQLKQDDQIEISTPRRGARTYLAIHTGFQADYQFGSSSTYLPAGFGGHKGRSIAAGDVLHSCGPAEVAKTLETPHGLRPIFTGGFALRACQSAETKCLSSAARESLFSKVFSAGRQATRMGIALNGHKLEVENNGKMKSAPVFPGTIQCPPSGIPIVLLCDAQVTGGYPRIASVARCDRHLLGQIRPGDPIRLLERSPEQAVQDYRAKQALFSKWLIEI